MKSTQAVWHLRKRIGDSDKIGVAEQLFCQALQLGADALQRRIDQQLTRHTLMTALTNYEGALQKANDDPDDEEVEKCLKGAREDVMNLLAEAKASVQALEAVANLWFNGWRDLPDARPVWGHNEHNLTVGDVKAACRATGRKICND